MTSGENMGLLLTLITIVHCVSGLNSTYETSLQTSILNGYRKSVKPSGSPLQVNISFSLVNILDYDAISSKFTMNGFFSFSWTDDRLTWTTADYGNINRTSITQENVWVPQMQLVSGYDQFNLLGLDELNVIYFYTGTAIWLPSDVFGTFCTADVKYFPVDVQTCEYIYYPAGYFPSQLTLNLLSSSIDISRYVDHPTWTLLSATNVLTTQGYEFYTLKFKIQRRSLFFAISMLLPIIGLCCMNILVFVLPADSGERVGYAITVLLAIAVYLTIVADALPSSSYPSVSVICFQLLAHLMISVMIMACVIFGLRFHLRESDDPDNVKDVPKWMEIPTKLILRSKYKSVSPAPNGENRKDTHLTLVDDSMAELGENEKIKSSGTNKSDVTDTSVSWKDVGTAFDRLCLVVYTMVIMLLDFVYIIVLFSRI